VKVGVCREGWCCARQMADKVDVKAAGVMTELLNNGKDKS